MNNSPNDTHPPEFDGPCHCEVCGKDVEAKPGQACECTECPVCHETGNTECFGTHVAALPQRYTWTVAWDNGHACDTLGTFDTKEAATNAGENWLSEMVAIDTNPAEAADAYSFEVLEPEEVCNTPEDIREAISSLAFDKLLRLLDQSPDVSAAGLLIETADRTNKADTIEAFIAGVKRPGLIPAKHGHLAGAFVIGSYVRSVLFSPDGPTCVPGHLRVAFAKITAARLVAFAEAYVMGNLKSMGEVLPDYYADCLETRFAFCPINFLTPDGRVVSEKAKNFQREYAADEIELREEVDALKSKLNGKVSA